MLSEGRFYTGKASLKLKREKAFIMRDRIIEKKQFLFT